MADYSFIIYVKPKSYNSWVGAKKFKKASYQQTVTEAFAKSYPGHKPLKTDLYGLVYHFYKSDISIDADNLSKPIWDCLREVLFDDDNRVKMRIAGSFDLSSDYVGFISSSGLPSQLIADILYALETEEHVLYVECGVFMPKMILLNLSQYAN